MDSNDVELDYAYMTQDALRGVVRQVLSVTQELGMPPGEHHFYIEFATKAPGVSISKALMAQYPERMTIVLQHQFEGLDVDAEGFAVTLHFGGRPDRLIVPFAAVTQFADPSASFALQFHPPALVEEKPGKAPTLRAVERDAADEPGDDEGPDETPPRGGGGGGGADVVSLDRFRKK
ncbi:SspB family protein [Parvularcula dongshanensis]|uniref:Stringent starvation protein B n=1 Tax=Parvularcula dongshanensis TaxID=1173995 RepID=A0A840I859_9PROT|nr:ClpXP protease specificity-enhancing factor SspB [Parvularcula dongshanensis]MBB4660140.1 hypothetical protein [Parvularcula dongshanensis]